jgi:hypothetical protein
VASALRSLAVFVGADAVHLRRVTPGRLRAPLARGLRDDSASPAGAIIPDDVGPPRDAVEEDAGVR